MCMLWRKFRPRPGSRRGESGRGLPGLAGPYWRRSYLFHRTAELKLLLKRSYKRSLFREVFSSFLKKPPFLQGGLGFYEKHHWGCRAGNYTPARRRVGGRGGRTILALKIRKNRFLRGSKNEPVFWSILCWFWKPFGRPKININQHKIW